MAPSMPPGRPGTLTADQEAKLKEMWQQTLEIFGVSHEEHANGTSTPSGTDSTPDAKKKKKGRLSMFHRRDKSEDLSSSGADGDNDKHGQTKEFQQALASQSPESLREAFWSMSKHDHPDALLLRFLRARKWDVQAALVMMISTLHWRMQEMHVDDDIMKNGEEAALRESKSSNAAEKKEGDDFMAQLRMGKSFLHGVDKEGRPCCIVRVRLHRQGEQSERSLERFTVYTIETTRMMLRPPVDTAVSHAPSHERTGSADGSIDNRLRHDRFQHGQHGLHPSEIHDQMLRSQLPGIPRQRACLQSPLDLPGHLENHQRLARSRCRLKSPLRFARRRITGVDPEIADHERTRR
jgi:hypothetical protein